MKLSERIRPDVDAAPWVVHAVQALESQVEIAESFHRVAVAERNFAWTEIECLKSAAPPTAAALPSFVATCARLRGLVEGIGCERWADSKGRRLKDTEEWVAFYVELSAFLVAATKAPPVALVEPLFLLHTGAVYCGERDDWEIEANSGEAVDAYCDANPGKTVGLYLAAPAQQPAANKENNND